MGCQTHLVEIDFYLPLGSVGKEVNVVAKKKPYTSTELKAREEARQLILDAGQAGIDREVIRALFEKSLGKNPHRGEFGRLVFGLGKRDGDKYVSLKHVTRQKPDAAKQANTPLQYEGKLVVRVRKDGHQKIEVEAVRVLIYVE